MEYFETLVLLLRDRTTFLENDIIQALRALQVNHQASDDSQFLQAALEIGLAVQRETNRR